MIRERLIRKIEAFFHSRTGRVCRYLPSARLGIYATLCEMFPPGAGLVISPVTDDIVLFTVLAAGLKPIFIDLDYKTGGLRPEKIPAAVAAGAKGVLTSNLYGIPEDLPKIRAVCDQYGLILIEDCAHAMGSTIDGKAVGTFGEISIFSLAKLIRGLGGIVTGNHPDRIKAIWEHGERYVRPPSLFADLCVSLRLLMADLLAGFPTVKRLVKSVGAPLLGSLPNPYPSGEGELNRGEGHRVPIRREDFTGVEERVGLDHYDQYIQIDNRRYREIPCRYRLYKMVCALAQFDAVASRHRTVMDRIAFHVPLERAQVPETRSACFYKIPFFSKEREKYYKKLAADDFYITCIYDPPFPDYVPSELFINQVEDRAAMLRWSREILPISPSDIEKVNDSFRWQRPLRGHGSRWSP